MIGVGFAAGIAVGMGGTYIFLNRTQQLVTSPAPEPRKAPSPPSTTTEPSSSVIPADPTQVRYHPALKYGAPNTDYVRFFTSYVASFDSRTRNPKWVIEHLTRDSVSGSGKRDKSEFFEDSTIEPRFRNRLADFRGSGFDRGHMAPASNHKSSQQAMDDTFSLVNMSPQVGAGFNRDYWARFERFVQDVVYKSDEVLVATGPLWVPHKGPDGKRVTQYQSIGAGPGVVAVPNYYYKVVLADARSGQHGASRMAVGAFVMPNSPIPPEIPLSAFVVPLDLLETVAGMQFFPGLINDTKRKAVDAAAVNYMQQGRPLLPPSGDYLLPGAAEVQGGGFLSGFGGGAEGVVHLCDMQACKLPSEKFWEGASGGKGKRGD